MYCITVIPADEEYEESQIARQKALSYPLPWRLWTYAFWLEEELPYPQGPILVLSVVFGTLILLVGGILLLSWLQITMSWLFWLVLGLFLTPLFRPLWRVWKSVAQEILAIERLYKKDHEDERL